MFLVRFFFVLTFVFIFRFVIFLILYVNMNSHSLILLSVLERALKHRIQANKGSSIDKLHQIDSKVIES